MLGMKVKGMEYGHVARECQKLKRAKDAAYHREKMLLCKQEKAGIQLNPEQANWKDDTDDESDDQELEAHYMSTDKYTHLINGLNQTVLELKNKLSAHQDTISILKQQKDAQIKLYKTREDKDIDLENKVKVLDNIIYKTGRSVQMMNMLNNKRRTSFAKPEYLKKAKQENPRLYDIGCYNDNLALMLSSGSDEEMVADLRYFNSLESEVDSLTSQLETQKTQFVNEIDRLSKEYFYDDHMNAILGLETELSKSKMMLKVLKHFRST
nr:hypothetical protein [Tanacetum cinerariifolium]